MYSCIFVCLNLLVVHLIILAIDGLQEETNQDTNFLYILFHRKCHQFCEWAAPLCRAEWLLSILIKAVQIAIIKKHHLQHKLILMLRLPKSIQCFQRQVMLIYDCCLKSKYLSKHTCLKHNLYYNCVQKATKKERFLFEIGIVHCS